MSSQENQQHGVSVFLYTNTCWCSMVVVAHHPNRTASSIQEFPQLSLRCRLHIAQNKCNHSQRTLVRLELISPDTWLSTHAASYCYLIHPFCCNCHWVLPILPSDWNTFYDIHSVHTEIYYSVSAVIRIYVSTCLFLHSIPHNAQRSQAVYMCFTFCLFQSYEMLI